MIRQILLMFTYGLSELYKFFPTYSQAGICDYKNPENGYGFPFSTMVLSPETYVHALCQHLIEVILALVVWLSWKNCKWPTITYLSLAIADTMDFLLTYSSPWFEGPPTFNHMKIAIYALSIIYEKWNNS